MQQAISHKETMQAKHPHELFLINLIFNHVFLFIAAVSAPSLTFLVLIVPTLSVGILAYTFWRARRAHEVDPWFVRCHWQVAARRSLVFVYMWLAVIAVVLAVLAVSGGQMGPQQYAFGGVIGLPLMGTMLVLILMESEAMQQAREGTLPRWAADRFACDAAQAEG